MQVSKQLFIHIGTHKTGSTAIQRALRGNRDVLRRNGMAYIEAPPCIGDLSRSLTLDAATVAQFKTYLGKEIGKQQSGNVKFLMSHECLSGDPYQGYANCRTVAAGLKEVTAGLDVKIIVYLRRQDDFLESWYTQIIQQGGSCSFLEYLQQFDAAAFDWAQLLDAYAACFGRENIIARRYHKTFLPAPESILRDFGAIIGIPDFAAGDTLLQYNIGYSRDALEIARLCNACLGNDEKTQLRAMLQRSNARARGDNYAFFTPEQRRHLLERYAASNAQAAENYFEDATESLFPEPDYSAEMPSYQGLNAENVAVVLTRALLAHQNSTGHRLERKFLLRIARFPKFTCLLKSAARKLGFKAF